MNEARVILQVFQFVENGRNILGPEGEGSIVCTLGVPTVRMPPYVVYLMYQGPISSWARFTTGTD